MDIGGTPCKTIAYALSECPAGNGWRHDFQGVNLSDVLDSSGNPISNSTSPARAIVSSESVAVVPLGLACTFYVELDIPRDYDDSRAGLVSGKPSDLSVQLTISQLTGSATPSIALTAVARPMAAAAKTLVSTSSQTQAGAAQTTTQTLTFDISTIVNASNVGIKAGDKVTCKFVVASQAEDLYLHRISLMYTKNPAFVLRSNRDNTAGTATE